MSACLAWLVRQDGRRRVRSAQAADDAGDTPAVDPVIAPTLEAALAAVAPEATWPAGLGIGTWALDASDGGPAQLWCSPGWLACSDATAAALDLAAASTPREWLERLEDRLLAASPGDPGDYAALAWWPHELPGDAP